MKILTPLKAREYLKPLVESGANELYLGYCDVEFEKRFGELTELNKMSSFASANVADKEQALALCREVRSMGAEAFVAFNSVCYTPEQVAYIADAAEEFKGKIGGVIAADISLIAELDRRGIPIAVSTIAGVYNRYAIEFLKRFKSVKRIILPRELSLKDIELLAGIQGFEYEAFLMHNGCRFADSHCLGFHSRGRGSVCAFLNSSNTVVRPIGEKPGFNEWSEFDLNHLAYLEYHREACGLCAIYRLFKAGISAVKIVGRANLAGEIADTVRLVKENIEIARQCGSEREYLESMRFPQNRHTRCASGMNCYYPEVRF